MSPVVGNFAENVAVTVRRARSVQKSVILLYDGTGAGWGGRGGGVGSTILELFIII